MKTNAKSHDLKGGRVTEEDEMLSKEVRRLIEIFCFSFWFHEFWTKKRDTNDKNETNFEMLKCHMI